MGILEVEEGATDDVFELLGLTEDDEAFEVVVRSVVDDEALDVLVETREELDDFVDEMRDEIEVETRLEDDDLDVLVITEDELSVDDLVELDEVLDLELDVAGAVEVTLDTVGGGGGVPGGAMAKSLF